MNKSDNNFSDTSRSIYFPLTAFAVFMPVHYAMVTSLPTGIWGVDVSGSTSMDAYYNYRKNNGAKPIDDFAIIFPSQRIKLRVTEVKKYQIGCDALDDMIG